MKYFRKIIADIKIESFTLYLCCRDRRVPLYSKLPAIIAAGLFFSPIDLIPDFIPLLGHVDDIIIIPLLIKLSKRLIPPGLLAENRDKAQRLMNNKPPVSVVTALLIAALWVSVIAVTFIVIIKSSPELRAFLHL